MREVYLMPNQVPNHLRGDYKGKKFMAKITSTFTIPAGAGLWDNGSRDLYYGIRISDGASVPFEGQDLSPWNSERVNKEIVIKPGFAIVRHSMISGVDMGLTFYMNPEDVAPLIPDMTVSELNHHQQLVLDYTASRKASYAGRTRYQMMFSELTAPWKEVKIKPPTIQEWENAKNELIKLGLLNGKGAITPSGRNLANQV